MVRTPCWVCGIILLLASFPLWAGNSEKIYYFGIPPQQSAAEIARRWTPVMQYLSQKSGFHIQLKTEKDIATYSQKLGEGGYDFGFSSPLQYIIAHKKNGLEAIVKEQNGKTIGLIVVRKNSSIQSVEQLNNQTLAFAGPTAFAATVLPVHYLNSKKVAVNIQYVTSIDSVYLSVAKGIFQAGGGEMRTFSGLASSIKDKLRVLWESNDLPPFAFYAHPRVSGEVIDKVQNALVEMGGTAQGQALLKTINFTKLEKADDHDYDALRKLNIKPLGTP
jgi:phosphonate transport system substrate-binding protein